MTEELTRLRAELAASEDWRSRWQLLAETNFMLREKIEAELDRYRAAAKSAERAVGELEVQVSELRLELAAARSLADSRSRSGRPAELLLADELTTAQLHALYGLDPIPE